MQTLGVGDAYYVDRNYTLSSIPPFLQYLNGIRTANNDAHSNPADGQFICFNVVETARVYILYANRRPIAFS